MEKVKRDGEKVERNLYFGGSGGGVGFWQVQMDGGDVNFDFGVYFFVLVQVVFLLLVVQ